SDVHESLEVDDLLDRPPVVDPPAAVEFGLVRQIEAQTARVAIELQQKPSLLLADADRSLLAPDVSLRQAVAQPAPGLADQLDVVRLEAHLLAQLAVPRGLRALVRPDASLRELPPSTAAPAGDQHASGAVHQDDADVRAIALFVDEVHGSGRSRRPPAIRARSS